METLNYIVKKYNVNLKQPSPIMLPIGRFKCIPKLFKELGFTKGVELGVFRAEYSMFLFNRIPNLHLIGVDAWDIYPGYNDFKEKTMRDAEIIAQDRYKDKNGKLIKGFSDEVVKQFEDESLDFVFIDGNHAYEFVVEDIALWSKKVRKGGIVFGHDYDDYSNHKTRKFEMGVIPAVDGWIKAYQIHPLFVTTNNSNRCWMYVKK